jgi:DUF971 family protein
MSGDAAPPSKISVSADRRVLRLTWPNTGERQAEFELTAEELRVWSPSAEVQGHGPGQAVLQTGKQNVRISGVEPVGRYAVRIIFDDGHETGLYSWVYLAELCENRDDMWAEYLNALEEAGATRG